MEMMRRCGAYDVIGAENFFRLGEDVIGKLFPRLDASICSSCKVRIFKPCKVDTSIDSEQQSGPTSQPITIVPRSALADTPVLKD
jgi:hypothetical protein